MTDIDYGSLYGVEGATESAPAEQTTEQTSEQVTEGADTAAEAGEKETEPAAQSADENAKYAAARRKAERERDLAIDAAIKDLGLTDSYTGKPITTKAEYDAFKAREAKDKKAEVAEAASMSEEAFDAFISGLPEVQRLKRAADAAEKQQQRLALDEQIREIAKLDPSVTSVEALMSRAEYPQIYARVQHGLSIVDAFRLENFDALTTSAAASARQSALNAANSKDHLAPTSTRGQGAVTVPAGVKAQYKLFNPTATDAEIAAHYNKYHNK